MIDGKDNTLNEYVNYEKYRYKRKGYGFIFAILFTIGFFTLGPLIYNSVYSKIYPGEEKINSGTFFVCLVVGVHQSYFIIINLVFCLIYKLKLPFFERYKVNDQPWPWEENAAEWRELLIKSLKNLFLNQMIVMPLSMGLHFLKGISPYNLDKNQLPSCFEVIWQITFFMLCEDTTFYWSHRLLHWDAIYPYIHKVHHQYKNTVSIASEYAHPIEFLFGNIITTSSGALILGQRTHMVTYCLWLLLRIGETCDGHSGYDFSWSPYRLLPFSGSSDYHNYHHYNYKGNYCSLFTFWDRICGTVNKNYIKTTKKKRELESNIKNSDKQE